MSTSTGRRMVGWGVRAGVCMALVLVPVGDGQAVAQASAVSETAVDRAPDLKRLQEWVELEQSLTPANRLRAQQRIASLLETGGPTGSPEFFLEVAAITALADNGHSNLGMAPVYRFGLVGIGTYWFSDGLYVVRAVEANRRLLGARMTAIGGKPLDQIVERLRAYHGGTDGFFREYFSTPLMLSPSILHAAGLSPQEDAAQFSFELPNGVSETVTLETYHGEIPRTRPWGRLLPRAVNADPAGWVSYLPIGTTMPLALQEPNEVFRYVLLADKRVAYIQLRANIDVGGQSIRDFLKQTRRRIRTDRPKAIILDNRQNGGGDLTRTADFALELPSLVLDDGMVYVLTSNATFSAGIYTSFFPKAANPAQTLVVGERVGDRERFWAETGKPFILPTTGYRIPYSLQLHDIGVGCLTPKICHMARHNKRWNIAVGSLDPDVKIGTTFADYSQHRDPPLEFVLEQVRDGSRRQR